MVDRVKLSQLRGWAIRGWSLTPGQLLTFNMICFRPNLSKADRRIFGKIFFASPSKLEFRNILRDYGQEIEIERFEATQIGESCSCEISTSRDGAINVTAQEIVLCHF